MKETIKNIVVFLDKGRMTPFIKTMVRTWGRVNVRLVFIEFLSWQKGQARLRETYTRKCDFRPWILKAEWAWAKIAVEIIENEPALSKVFEVNGNSVKFRDAITDEERLEVENYIDNLYQPKLRTRESAEGS